MRSLKHRGYLVSEAALGLMLIGVIMTSLVIAIVRQNRTSAALAETRSLVAAAEDAMSRLQAGTQPAVPADMTLMLTQRKDVKDGVGQRVWAELVVEQGGKSFALTGLVPRPSLETWQRNHPATAPAEVKP